MTNITLSVSKSAVLDEVAKTTAYTGGKMAEGSGAYNRIFTTDADQEMLERFWTESQASVCETLKKFLQDETEADGTYTIELGLSASFDEQLTKSMQKELFSFFVMNITAKWFTFSNKGEAGDYASAASTLLLSVHKKALYKKKPTRPTY